jgi:catabolite regulation protein CreA
MDGSCSVKQRQALVDTFNNPEVRAVCCYTVMITSHAVRNCLMCF